MDKRIFLYGAGGHAKVLADIAERSGSIIKGAFDANLFIKRLLDRYPVYADIDSAPVEEEDNFVVAIGNNALRKRTVEIELNERKFIVLIHPAANISRYSDIGEGTVIMGGTTINVNVQIGRHCIVNTNASIDHDCVIEDYVHLSPNVALAGNVLIGEGTHVGIGACVIPGINIGKWCTIGAGAVIIRDVPDGATVVGNPGRIIKE